MNCLVSPALRCSCLHARPRETKPFVYTPTSFSTLQSIPRRISIRHPPQAWTMAGQRTAQAAAAESCVKSKRQQQRKRSATKFQCQALQAVGEGDVQGEMTTSILEERGVREMLRKFKVTEVPDYYIKPLSVRQQAATIVKADAAENCLPVIDLSSSREDLIRSVRNALQSGFFQIINHGVSADLHKRIAAEAKEFFALSVEEKLRCSTPKKVAGPVHFGGGTKGDWRDVLKLNCAPASAVAMDYWPVHPVGFRDTLLQYVAQNKGLASKLLGIISESLGLDVQYIARECGDDSRILTAINHYPPCPDPSLTMGIREHSDPNTLTILLPDQVPGLQAYKNGLWFDIKPLERALVVNAGDHLQILSNGRYPSCLHRVVTNKTQPRTSVALFFSPALSAHIKPAPALVDEDHPARYREFVYLEYLKNFYHNGGPNRKVVLGEFQSGNLPLRACQ